MYIHSDRRACGSKFADAAAAYKEAAAIRRELATQDPAAYRSDLAQILTNLAFLYRERKRRVRRPSHRWNGFTAT